MRSDPYQERARALAVEAGLDPDAKIDRPGQRPMPTWCLFRDAARKEKLARDAQVVAADIALKPQAAQYQNSPLKIFGKHDDATIAQMRNCMSVGNAVAGVICADGHLGYAQLVGKDHRLAVFAQCFGVIPLQRVHRHHEVAVAHGPIGSIPVEWMPTSSAG